MATFNIFSKDGKSIRHSGAPKYSGSHLGVAVLEFAAISSPTPITWERGDYVDYFRTGMRYRLYSVPTPKKQATRGSYGAAFVYSNVKFYASTKDLEIAPFRDLVPKDNKIHYSTRPEVSTTENVYGIAERIQECMNDIFPDKWEIKVFDTDDADLLALFNEVRDFSVSNGSCLDALSEIYDLWKNVGWIHTYDSARDKEIITIGRSSLRDFDNTTKSYAYGYRKGLTSLKKAAANEGEFATRLYVFGSDRNIQTRYYNGLDIYDNESVDIANLMLPLNKWGLTDGKPDARKAYLQADNALIEKYGLIPRTVYFDGSGNEEIYPSIAGLTFSEVRRAILESGASVGQWLPADLDKRLDIVSGVNNPTDDGKKEDVEANRYFYMGIPGSLGFSVVEQGKLTSEGYATISMKTGMCAGREFKVKSQAVALDGSFSFMLERVWDESIGEGFPNRRYTIAEGDQFVLLDIPMPDYYISLAQDRLLKAGEKMLEDYSRISAYYEPTIDSIVVSQEGGILEGMYMAVYDEDIIDTDDNKDYVLIDTLSIDENGELPKYQVTLREQKRSARTFGTLEDMIEDTKRGADEKIARERQYTERRFRDAKETLDMLEKALVDGFSDSISPLTINTMSMLVGNEANQFYFIDGMVSQNPKAPSFRYEKETKTFKSDGDFIKHMTLGINSVSPTHSASEYKTWNVVASQVVMSETDKAYYLYIKASKSNVSASFVVSTTAIKMEEVGGYYHFLVGIYNSEYNEDRSFAPLYGYTEILPGQITTDVIKDGNSRLVIDLANAIISAKDGAMISGDITFGSNSTGLSNVPEFDALQGNVEGLQDGLISVNKSIGNLQDQIDGVVENYFWEGVPTPSNYPANEWDDDIKRANHIGDTYTNIASYEKDPSNAGKSWRWTFTDIEHTGYHWHPIADSDAVKALQEAAKAQTTADGKARTFVSTPYTPYDEGDLWVQGESGDILRCKSGIHKTKNDSYSASDWERASNYTDGSNTVNLITEKTEEVLVVGTATASNSYNELFAEFEVSPNEEYTFRVDSSRITSGSSNGFTIAFRDTSKGIWYDTAEGNTLIPFQATPYYTTLKIKSSVAKAKVKFLVFNGQKNTGDSGRIIELTRPSLVKGSVPMVVWKPNTDYLFNAFANGTTKISGGLVMSQAVMVEDGGVVQGMLNGSDYGKDSTHKKLILAAGSNGASEANMRAAKTRIYEDGHVESNSINLKEGCKIGAVSVTEKGITIDTKNNSGRVVIDEDGIMFSSADGNASIGNCAGAAVQALGKGGYLACPSNEFNVGLHASSAVSGAAIFCNRGMYYGLRPRLRTLNFVGGEIAYLDEFDHTIVVSNLGAADIYLPSSPMIGQEYRIWKKTNSATLTINGNGKNLCFIYDGGSGETASSTSITKVNVVDLVYDGTNWLFNKSY